MTKYVLQCEDSPQGIFSAVYSAWELKYGHERTSIQACNKEDSPNLELFAEYIQVETVQEKAKKVMHTIRTRFSEEVLEELYLVASSNGEDKADVVYHYVQLLLSMGIQARRHLSNPYIVRAMELARAAGNERHHYLGFLRFIETTQGILLGRFEPKNNITELVMPHFSDRFPEERFVIWDTNRNVAGVHLHGADYVMLLLTVEQAERLGGYQEQKEETEGLWRAFVESISIKARENGQLQRNNLPLRFRTYMPEFHAPSWSETKAGDRYKMRAVLFDTIAACGELKKRLAMEGILYGQVVFGLQTEEALSEAVSCLGVRPEECLLLTNSKHHAEAAKRLFMPCIGCIEGTYELPRVDTLLESPDEASVTYLNMVYCHEMGYPAFVLETPRCSLRELAMTDASRLYAICTKLKKGCCLDEPLATPEAEAEKLSAYIKTVYPFFGYGFFGICEREGGKVIGVAGFQEGSVPLEIGYLLDESVWGAGIATEVVKALVEYAKEELDVSEIVAKISQDNVASRRVAEKCGVRIVDSCAP